MALTDRCGCTDSTNDGNGSGELSFEWTVNRLYQVVDGKEEDFSGTVTLTKVPTGFRVNIDELTNYLIILTGADNFTNGTNYSASFYDGNDVLQQTATESDNDYTQFLDLTNSDGVTSITVGIYGKV